MRRKVENDIKGKIKALLDSVGRNAEYLDGPFDREEDKSAALDLFEHEAEIAGIADRLLRGYSLTEEDRKRLALPILEEGKLRSIPNHSRAERSYYDVSEIHSVLLQAKNMESLRRLCLSTFED